LRSKLCRYQDDFRSSQTDIRRPGLAMEHPDEGASMIGAFPSFLWVKAHLCVLLLEAGNPTVSHWQVLKPIAL
jgi:hypothetical protein